MKNYCAKIARRLAILPRFRSLSDVLLFSHIVLFAATVPQLHLPLPRLMALLRPRTAPPVFRPARIQHITDYVDTAIQAGSPLIENRCYIRGLTLYYFLSRAGLDVELCFGVGSQDAGHPRHCWLVRDGKPYLEAEDPQAIYTPIYYFPAYNHSSTT